MDFLDYGIQHWREVKRPVNEEQTAHLQTALLVPMSGPGHQQSSKIRISVTAVSYFTGLSFEVTKRDLRALTLNGFGCNAYFEWVTEYGDPIADIFFVLTPVVTINKNLM